MVSQQTESNMSATQFRQAKYNRHAFGYREVRKTLQNNKTHTHIGIFKNDDIIGIN